MPIGCFAEKLIRRRGITRLTKLPERLTVLLDRAVGLRGRKFVWFVLLWLAGVVCVSIVAYAIRLAIMA